MPDELIKDDFFTIIKCGTCGTEWEYLRDQIQCTKCLRMPNIEALRNRPKQQQAIKIPTYCDDCNALKEFWTQCNDCGRVTVD